MKTVDPTGIDAREFGDHALAEGETVVHSPQGEVLVLGHRATRDVVENPEQFSSAVSSHLQIPNGLDGEEHSRFRALIERYLTDEALAEFQPAFAAVARETVDQFEEQDSIDAVGELGAYYAVHAMLAWLNWPTTLAPRLIAWVISNGTANRSGDPQQAAGVAAEFDDIIREVVEPRLENPTGDVTSNLVHDQSLGRRLTFDEIVSILRNWTGGDLSSMAYCIGVILHGLAQQPAIQDRLRQGISAREFDAILDEFLRLDSPFVTNRRITTCPVTLAGNQLETGQRVRVVWTAANRDSAIVDKPESFDPEAHAEHNLVWGSGPHVCPGRGLSMLELRTIIGEILARAEVSLAGEGTREVYPTGGWRSLPVTLQKR
ncbi:cytochrome P450 [Corynebacterium lubricantis]|uniref:cytochrome P450 n=1 Tax=Corynebacterium lubricantis TaxID=541095 RepID=UPI00037F92DA|nr:cytochrome P450 [Corynebacterium lubricantis]